MGASLSCSGNKAVQIESPVSSTHKPAPLTDGRSVLKDKFRNNGLAAAFSCDPFIGTGNWSMEFDDSDMLGHDLHMPGSGTSRPVDTDPWKGAKRPTMCAKMACKEAEALLHDREPVVEVPPGELSAFLRSHSAHLSLRCKSHPGSSGDSFPIFIRPLAPQDRAAIQSGLSDLTLRSQVPSSLSFPPKPEPFPFRFSFGCL